MKMSNTLGTKVSRRRFVMGGGAGAAGGLVSGSILLRIPRANAAGTLSIQEQLDWLPSGQILGDTVAKSLGYFEEEGLDATLVPGGPNVNGVASVASGQATVGNLSSSPNLMLARASGIPIKCIAVGFQQHPFAFFSLPKNPVRTVEDLRGKKVGMVQTAFVLMKAMLKMHNIPESDVTVVALGGQPGPLLQGQVDVLSNWDIDSMLIEPLGPDRVEMRLWDTGVKLYASPYYTTETTLKEHPEVLAAFIRAVSRGWAYAKANPEKAVELFCRAYPSHDVETEMKSVNLTLSYVFNAETAKNGWGTMTTKIWSDNIAMYDDLGQFAVAGRKAPTVEDLMTMAILDATANARPKLG
jgi:NitT/TauT family transport system substrate-binding protein